MKLITGFCRFWYDLIVGDCWQIAEAIVVSAVVAIGLLRFDVLAPMTVTLSFAVAIMLAVVILVVSETGPAVGGTRQLWTTLKRIWIRHTTRQQLLELDPHQLDDVGITRDEIEGQVPPRFR